MSGKQIFEEGEDRCYIAGRTVVIEVSGLMENGRHQIIETKITEQHEDC